MRSIRHWTPKYLRDRTASFLYERSAPEAPWLTRAANEILASCLRPTDIGLEFGSGRSTHWFAARVGQLTSIEHDPKWATKVREKLAEDEISNVQLRLFPQGGPGISGEKSPYVNSIEGFDDRSLDFCIVDGIYREYCAIRVLPKIRPGGLLIIDNVNWFLPSSSRSPNSRSVQQGPSNETWSAVMVNLLEWRTIWTTSGVTDTAIYFRPCSETAPR